MKVYVVSDIVDGPMGGRNQLVKFLIHLLKEKDLYTEVASEADIILFDSWHRFNDVIELKKIHEDKIFVHRLDGPIKLYNNMDDNRDDIIYSLNQRIASATIFQSEYSKINNAKMGLDIDAKPHTVISNVADGRFFRPMFHYYHSDNKIQIVSTSFSKNFKKGFDVYQYIDENLDFDKYDYTFIGNTPIKFKNIVHKEPMTSTLLGIELNTNHMYITASLNDSCSNSLLEAKACGLPVIARNSGGHPEIIGDGGMLFNDTHDIIETIDTLSQNLDQVTNQVVSRSPEEFVGQYIQFFTDLLNKSRINND